MPQEDEVKDVLRTCRDSVLPVNIVDLGLIYGVTADDHKIEILMTLTSECEPSHAEVPKNVEAALKKQFPGIPVEVKVVFNPLWTPGEMNENAKAALGIRDA